MIRTYSLYFESICWLWTGYWSLVRLSVFDFLFMLLFQCLTFWLVSNMSNSMRHLNLYKDISNAANLPRWIHALALLTILKVGWNKHACENWNFFCSLWKQLFTSANIVKLILNILQSLQENTCTGVSLFKIFQATINLIIEVLRHKCFLVNFSKVLGKSFFAECLWATASAPGALSKIASQKTLWLMGWWNQANIKIENIKATLYLRQSGRYSKCIGWEYSFTKTYIPKILLLDFPGLWEEESVDNWHKQSPSGVLQKSCPEKSRKIHWKTLVLQSLFNDDGGKTWTLLTKDFVPGVFL